MVEKQSISTEREYTVGYKPQTMGLTAFPGILDTYALAMARESVQQCSQLKYWPGIQSILTVAGG
jgi:hypothetical protein